MSNSPKADRVFNLVKELPNGTARFYQDLLNEQDGGKVTLKADPILSNLAINKKTLNREYNVEGRFIYFVNDKVPTSSPPKSPRKSPLKDRSVWVENVRTLYFRGVPVCGEELEELKKAINLL